MTSDQVLSFFASVRDHVIAFLGRLFDRSLPFVEGAWNWVKENPQATIALASLFVAAVAFCSSLRASMAQQKHNQLSVRPLANIMFGDYENGLVVKVVNNGTGPMIVKSITVINAPNPSEPLIKAMPPLPYDDVTWRHFAADCTDRSIRSGGELVLLHLVDNGKALEDHFALSRNAMRAALGLLRLRVEYTDIYEKRFVTERSLDFFLRTLPRDPPMRTNGA